MNAPKAKKARHESASPNVHSEQQKACDSPAQPTFASAGSRKRLPE